jgi:hypothetical protein
MLTLQNFLVVDTEGTEQLREIAVVDSQGQVIYQAFNTNHEQNSPQSPHAKPLDVILKDFTQLVQNRVVVFHSAAHDLDVLKNSYQKLRQKVPTFTSLCTYELARQYFSNFQSYSLEYLSKKLHLKVRDKYFNPQQAHSASYDAEFTYQLYQKIYTEYITTILKNKPNPFSSSRVDTPFQDHADQSSIFENEFAILKSVIGEIKQDKNYQSRGVVVLGKAGSGKTHLMMRLAKELLQVNRLLFVRCPNHPDSILHHTYSRILESLMQEVGKTGYRQLEYLLAHSFVKLISQTQIIKLTQKDQDIVECLRGNPLNLYEGLGAEGTAKKRDYWQHIEKRARDWWIYEYGIVGYSDRILKGIIKFCSYSDIKRKELVSRWLAAAELEPEDLEQIGLDNWTETMSKEAFSLEAISVLSRLSLLDEPLIIVFDQLESLGFEYNRKLLLNFGEGVKELFTHVPNSLIILNLFPERWQEFQEVYDGSVVDRLAQNTVHLSKPSLEELKQILNLKLRINGINIEQVFSQNELDVITQQESIRKVINKASDYYRNKVYGIKLTERIVKEEEISKVAQASLEARLEKVENNLVDIQETLAILTNKLNTEIIYREEKSKDTQEEVKEVTDITKKERKVNKPSTIKTKRKPDTILQEYMRKTRIILEESYSNLQIITDSDDVGKVTAIANTIATIFPLEIDYLRLGKHKIPEHLLIKTKEQNVALAFLEVDGNSFTSRLKNLNELVLERSDIIFQVWRDARQPKIRGKVGLEQIAKLNHAPNGRYLSLEKRERINLELMYKLITDIQNQDFEIDLEEAIKGALEEMQDSYLLQVFVDVIP